jgi:hypothetical protein
MSEGKKKRAWSNAGNADGGIRTHDLMLRRHALYPLSYVSTQTV